MCGVGGVTWQPIETAPDLERVLVCGWQKPRGSIIGYWWWHEDCCHEGRAIEHPSALYWANLDIPDFPEPPE